MTPGTIVMMGFGMWVVWCWGLIDAVEGFPCLRWAIRQTSALAHRVRRGVPPHLRGRTPADGVCLDVAPRHAPELGILHDPDIRRSLARMSEEERQAFLERTRARQ
ncbi:hypothetical protein [Myxococcus sp. NMCA1]|uniref:hypothetical protein n=1 Tax=Myxococcus sp. NMCA1 TaxID=2996785 RepID=UPI002286589A|nr:hypothetical protein [Myxococcus sp. NMCA1]WAM23840.1 hypothetical protein OZ403_25195 [Myxococcus sp. NMCA1]